ncbi:hypothetical protein FRX31_018532 [Thalictrum thalictroides]|uniref:Uncharacterized protein n=1 Tax=Thalictrum thalictroides TaxID=46969 RepID=A0A7J6W3V8_THATH|nr:hypothetical protein FRX31_018532 [Thalictrum thalictroides]
MTEVLCAKITELHWSKRATFYPNTRERVFRQIRQSSPLSTHYMKPSSHHPYELKIPDRVAEK